MILLDRIWKWLTNFSRGGELSFDCLFTKNPQPMWVYDAETLKFMEANEEAIAKYGYSREELLGMTVKDIRPQSEVQKFLNNARPGTRYFEHDGVWKHKMKDGSLRDVQIFSSMTTFKGRPAVVVSANDITERRASEEIIRLQSNALEAAANGIVITDKTGAAV